MKTTAVWLLLGILTLCGCARHYVLTLNNGAQIGTTSKPQLKNGMYYFKDASGKDDVLPAGRVREVAPASMANDTSKSFNGSVK